MDVTSVAGIVGLSIGGIMALYLLVAFAAAPFFSRKPKVDRPAEGENIGESKVRYCEVIPETATASVASLSEPQDVSKPKELMSSSRFPAGATVPGRSMKENAASTSQVNVNMDPMKEVEAAPDVVIDNMLHDQQFTPKVALDKMMYCKAAQPEAALDKMIYDTSARTEAPLNNGDDI